MHCSEDIREEFQTVLRHLYIDGKRPTFNERKIAGRVWKCTDILPGDDCEILDIPRGSTYAQAVRKMKQDISALRSLFVLK